MKKNKKDRYISKLEKENKLLKEFYIEYIKSIRIINKRVLTYQNEMYEPIEARWTVEY